jgi:2-C-methyl-D-erythritol 4-phosphate cytidylyltransferase
MRVAALVLGAGRGERLALDVPKAFVPLAGRPLLAHALEALIACAAIERVVPVVPSAWRSRLAAQLGPIARHAKLLPAVAGGATRQDSLAAGLEAVPRDFELVAVHDAARPFVRADAVARVIAAARAHGAALLAAPAADTIKRVRGGEVVETPPRDECYAAQTPQVFRADWLREGVAKAAAEGRVATDCSQLVEALGVRVKVVAGDPDNRKITDAADLAWAERRLSAEGA